MGTLINRGSTSTNNRRSRLALGNVTAAVLCVVLIVTVSFSLTAITELSDEALTFNGELRSSQHYATVTSLLATAVFVWISFTSFIAYRTRADFGKVLFQLGATAGAIVGGLFVIGAFQESIAGGFTSLTALVLGGGMWSWFARNARNSQPVFPVAPPQDVVRPSTPAPESTSALLPPYEPREHG